MEVLRVVAVLAALCNLFSQAALLDDSLQKLTDVYRTQIAVIYDEIVKECPYFNSRLKRENLNGEQLIHLEVHKQLYHTLLKQLVECKKSHTNLTTTSTHITTVTITVTTTTPTTTKRTPTETPIKNTPTTAKKPAIVTNNKWPWTKTKTKTPTSTTTKKPAFSSWPLWTIKTGTRSPTIRKPLISPVPPKACQQAKTYKDS